VRSTGTDIHGWVEVKEKERWHGVIKIDRIISRNYDMFGCLFGEKHRIFEPVAKHSIKSLGDVSDEAAQDDRFNHIGYEQSLTYREIIDINWDEVSIELIPQIYIKDGFGVLNVLKNYELLDSEYDRLNKEKSLQKDNIIYNLELIKRRSCLDHQWIRLFALMRCLSYEYGENNTRLIVWFDK
jgi:hypothetical protein